METNTISARKYIIKYGVILGISSVMYNIVVYLTDNIVDGHWGFTVAGTIILIGVIIYGIHAYKSKNNGFLKLGTALKIGTNIALLGGVISIIWNVFFINLVESDMTNQILDKKQEKIILQNLDKSPQQMHKSMKIVKKNNSLYISSAFSLTGYLLFGFIITLLGGLIMHKKQNL